MGVGKGVVSWDDGVFRQAHFSMVVHVNGTVDYHRIVFDAESIRKYEAI